MRVAWDVREALDRFKIRSGYFLDSILINVAIAQEVF